MMLNQYNNRIKENAPAATEAGNQKYNYFSLSNKHRSFKHFDAITGISNAMLTQGIEPPEIIDLDGVLHRFHIDGDKGGSKNGWYVGHTLPYSICTFGSWKTGLQETWRDCQQPMTTAESRALNQTILKAKLEKQRDRETHWLRVADEVNCIWQSAKPADPKHPYLIRKRVMPHNLRQSGDKLIVPLQDTSGAIWSLQTIYPDGTKRFTTGGRTKGLFSLIGDLSTKGQILICEGWATGASLFEHLADPVLCAMNAGNLLPVAESARATWNQQLVICGDDDRKTEGNPGKTFATKAALAVGALTAFPEFDDDFGSDFNDYFVGAQNAK
jgi:putative DNA primase/helicase